MEQENLVVEKSLDFGVEVIKFCELLDEKKSMLFQNNYSGVEHLLAPMYLKPSMRKVNLTSFIK